MWPLFFEPAEAGAVLLTALTVKIMDDFLDRDQTSPFYLEDGAIAYGLAFFGFAVFLDASLSLSLFCAAYAVGMLRGLDRRLPSGLSGWEESLLALAIAMVVFGPARALWAVTAVFAIDLLDDGLDRDRKGRLAPAELLAMGTATLVLAFWLDAAPSFLVALASLPIMGVEWIVRRRRK